MKRRRSSYEDATTVSKESPNVTAHRHPTHRKTQTLAALVLVALAALIWVAPASAAPAPAWQISLASHPTVFKPGLFPSFFAGPEYTLVATNVGGAPSDGSKITISDTLPAGITPFEGWVESLAVGGEECEVEGQEVICSLKATISPGGIIFGYIKVRANASIPDPTVFPGQVTISGGGAVATGVATTETTVSNTPASFGLLSGRNGYEASTTDAEGLPVTQAGSHPEQATFDLGFPSARAGFTNAAVDGGVRDIHVALPRGMIVDPLATPVRCTEAQLESELESCPNASAVGLATPVLPVSGGIFAVQSPLYSMVPPPGVPAVFAFNAGGASIYVHLLGGLRAGDYALTSDTHDIDATYGNPFYGIGIQLWGDPSSSIYDHLRGECGSPSQSCPVAPQTTPLLTMPTACAGSMPTEAAVDSWGHTGVFDRREAEVTNLEGNPTGVTGCSSLEFEPTLKARPTTNVADSPSGLEADLHIPQHEVLGTLAEAHLKEAVVTLPKGMAINPSSANGLSGCTSSQIGIDPETGVANGDPVACPDASKIGTVEVDTPLLDHPTGGAVYVATPHDNPFDSLLAIYVVADDPQTGTLVKLAGHVEADPQTGRLTTTFADNPQLPFEDFKLDFFGGAGGPLRTPATCGEYSTTSQLAPWSGNPSATPSDTYAISQAPGGGSCPTGSGTEPNAPSFDAGTVSPIAGAYSPMVVNLRRNDGSQEFSSVTLTPPPGLVGKLAGIPYCPESALKAAEQKTGTQERANPSCPAASKVGTVSVGAGAGPAPYYTTGNAYLTPPYKGAPLSLAIVTPATAGPYDLGTVVVRTALNVNSETAQITGVSDPIPHILQGIPLDVRSVQVKLDRNQFTLNGTSCNPFAFTGTELSALGQSSPLSSRFQLGECAPLPFKPKLSFRLRGKTNRGGNPAFSATLTMPPGSANIAAAKVALPKSEFLDNAHIGTVCTRVQFAEGGGHGEHCPAASIYGFAKASTPLLDGPVEGPVFLRSSDHELPDLVASLRGQISVDLDGRVDSINGGIRNSFEIVPDAPVTSFTLEMAGGAKGLLENSTNICRGIHRATVEFTAQNGKVADLQPALKNSRCAHAKKHRHHRAKRHQRHAVR